MKKLSDTAHASAPSVDTARRSLIGQGVALLALLSASTSATSAATATGRVRNTAQRQLDVLLEAFTATATDEDRLDFSAKAFEQERKTTSAMLKRLRAIDRRRLAGDDLINCRFAESLLAGQELDQDRRLWKMDPRVYLQLAGLSRLIDNPDATDTDAAKAQALLSSFPAQMSAGMENLSLHVPRFRELALFMIRGAQAVVRESVPEFAHRHPARQIALLAASERASSALAAFEEFVRDRLPTKPNGDYAIGKQAYDRMLRQQYLLDHDADSLYQYGREQFDKTVAKLKEVAARIDPAKTWQELATQIKSQGPEPEKMIEAHQEWVDKARAHVIRLNLVPIPWKERVEVVPRAAYLRKTSYYGDFEGAVGPDSDGVWVGRWKISPYEPEWDENTKHQYLVEHDWGVIIDTAPHETYAGHHVQGLYQAHNPHKLRRKFGIAIFSEGWGLYNETLMYETGFFPDDRIHLRQLQLRLWRIARVVWDVGLHAGKLSYDECVSLLADGVGFQRWAAELEVDASATEPGYRIGYFMGASEIMRLREEMKRRLGATFALADFHERLLKVGNMPPSLMRAGLMASYGS